MPSRKGVDPLLMRPAADIFLAFRYLRPKGTFVSVITLLSIVGPLLGVMLLVIVSAVMAGFDRDIKQRILDMQAHLQVHPGFAMAGDDRPVFHDPEPILKVLKSHGAAATPAIEGPVLIQLREEVTTKFVKGIIPETEKLVTGVHTSEGFRGRFEIEEGEALIGIDMAAELGLDIGDELLIHSPGRLTRNIRWQDDGSIKVAEPDEVYFPEEVRIAGIFSMGVYEYDTGVILVHLDQAADLFGFDWGSATSIQARVPDPWQMTELTQAVRAALPACRVITWQEANRVLFGALRVEKNLMFFLLTFIVLVASFCITATLITVVVHKTREIGIMKAVGMGRVMIARVFLIQGAVIGAIGTTLGVIAGLLIVRHRNEVAALLARITGEEIFPKSLYHLSQIPGYATPKDVVLIVCLALAICVGASLIPAVYAGLLSPARALQEEN